MRKRTLDEIKRLEYVKRSELAELNGVRYSTVTFYSELGLLPYEQRGKRLAKYYPAKRASERLKEILRLREKGLGIADIIRHFHTKPEKITYQRLLEPRLGVRTGGDSVNVKNLPLKPNLRG